MRIKIAAFIAGAMLGLSSTAGYASTILAPLLLNPGATISSLPNSGSSGNGIEQTIPYDDTQPFTFEDGLSVILRARVIDYADAPSAIHPGLYFDYEIQVVSGAVDSFSVGGWTGTNTYVKICGISICGGSGANGISPDSVSRSLDGSQLTWDYSSLTAGQHSANLQVFAPVGGFIDPLASFTDASGNTFSVDTVGPLVSVVPLPASAPMFGAALLALGVAGYGLKRKGNAATAARSQRT